MFVKGKLCFFNLSLCKHSPNFVVYWYLHVDYKFLSLCSTLSHPVQHNWIFPCGPLFGASHRGTQIVIKARSSADGAGWLLTAGFRNSAVPSRCCWQEISARLWCAEQELIWSGLSPLKETSPEVMHHGRRGDNLPTYSRANTSWFLPVSQNFTS